MTHQQVHILAGCFISAFTVLVIGWNRAPHIGGTFRVVISNLIVVWAFILAGLTGIVTSWCSMLMYQQLLLGLPWWLFSSLLLVVGMAAYPTISESFERWEWEKRKQEILYG